MKLEETNGNKRFNKYLYHEGQSNKKPMILEENDTSFKNIEIITKLIKMGYELDCLNRAHTKYKFKTIEEALAILNKDEEIGKFTHPFLEVKGKKTCGICNNYPDIHLDNYKIVNQVEESAIGLQSSYINSNTNHIITENNNFTVKMLNNNNSNNNKINKKPVIKKLSIKKIQEMECDYKGKNLCLICFVSELDDENTYIKKNCYHKICMNCVKTYLQLKINEAKVENIYCLHPGCQQVIMDEEIRQCLDFQYYSKYKKFKRRILFMKNTNRGFIPCAFPNCEEFVQLSEMSNNVTCDLGHSFCANCKERCHDGDCSYSAIERILRDNEKIKMCPCCKSLIEKSSDETCNHMTCSCGYEFCWLCLKEYNQYHFSFFNVTGCPGLKYSIYSIKIGNPKKSFFKNPIIKFFWYLLSLICSLVVGVFVLIFFCLFGACYELLMCYIYGYNEEELSNESSLFIYTNRKLQSVRNSREEFKPNYFIIFLLILCGLLLQPFYLCFKFFIALMECYKNYGCWFYLYASS